MREIGDRNKFKDNSDEGFNISGIEKLLEAAYLETRREPHDRPKKSFAPSSIGYGSGTCPRSWFYNFTGGVVREDDTDALGIGNMAYGSEAHERLQELFKSADILIAKEVKAACDDPPIFGYVDLLIRWNGEPVVGEIKTTKEQNFLFRKNSMRPSGYHLLQVLIYMKVMNKDKGFILYENKNSQNVLTLPVLWTDENVKLIDDTFEWMRMVKKNQEEGTLPKRPFTKSSIPCKSCDFRKHCWQDDEGVVDLPPLVVPK